MEKETLLKMKSAILENLINNSRMLILNDDENYRSGLFHQRREIFEQLKKNDDKLKHLKNSLINEKIINQLKHLDSLCRDLVNDLSDRQGQIEKNLLKLNQQKQARNYLKKTF